jgi:hypothetical protein
MILPYKTDNAENRNGIEVNRDKTDAVNVMILIKYINSFKSSLINTMKQAVKKLVIINALIPTWLYFILLSRVPINVIAIVSIIPPKILMSMN